LGIPAPGQCQQKQNKTEKKGLHQMQQDNPLRYTRKRKMSESGLVLPLGAAITGRVGITGMKDPSTF
jgi:hypothetical protein